jgi:hypothetical protein
LGDDDLRFDLFDDGTGVDATANDGVWTGKARWKPSAGGWARLEVTAIDGVIGHAKTHTVQTDIRVEGASADSSFFNSVLGESMPIIGAVLGMLLLALVSVWLMRRRRLSADLEMIEGWGSRPARSDGFGAEAEVEAQMLEVDAADMGDIQAESAGQAGQTGQSGEAGQAGQVPPEPSIQKLPPRPDQEGISDSAESKGPKEPPAMFDLDD